ncbi:MULTISPECIES: alpha/beta hydrolase [Asticcacaulis]|uniref:alpha/beta hydrolase n=1 Tax=Asticcacaulis TaxID=76890 RepID=UPI001AE1A4A6|nr:MULTISPECIES: alpha/beta hydrolase [Asticcacaulis]MBP2160295.1 pimeloyl-ACP methyl ester carboxylesterase [Asticcacaulis solisilvae]MDR6801402.1 pimeloyl-ACP methyl ester carboxylesterase [Asticcacaulis sp. BE141]
MPKQILFVQGGGENVHDQWDNALVNSLRHELGASYDVAYPRMPEEANPQYAIWKPALLDAFDGLSDGAVLVGHSVGGTILLHLVAEGALPFRPGAVIVIAPPFAGEGGWPGDGLPRCDLASDLPEGVTLRLFYGTRDQDVPLSHAGLYAKAVPRMVVTELPGRDHQLNNDLGEIADAIRALG